MKKILSLILMALLALSAFTPALAANETVTEVDVAAVLADIRKRAAMSTSTTGGRRAARRKPSRPSSPALRATTPTRKPAPTPSPAARAARW